MAVDLAIVSVVLLVLLAYTLLLMVCQQARMRELEHDLDMALGWAEAVITDDAVVHPPLHLVGRATYNERSVH